MSAEATFIVQTDLPQEAMQQRINHICAPAEPDFYEVRPWTARRLKISIGSIVGGEFWKSEYHMLNHVICYLLSIASDKQIFYYRDPSVILSGRTESLQRVKIHTLQPFWPDVCDADHEYVMNHTWAEFQSSEYNHEHAK